MLNNMLICSALPYRKHVYPFIWQIPQNMFKFFLGYGQDDENNDNNLTILKSHPTWKQVLHLVRWLKLVYSLNYPFNIFQSTNYVYTFCVNLYTNMIIMITNIYHCLLSTRLYPKKFMYTFMHIYLAFTITQYLLLLCLFIFY